MIDVRYCIHEIGGGRVILGVGVSEGRGRRKSFGKKGMVGMRDEDELGCRFLIFPFSLTSVRGFHQCQIIDGRA